MKSFIFALCLSALILGGVVGNYLYINNVANTLEKSIDSLPDIKDEGCVEAIGALSDYWDSQKDYVCLSVAFPVLDRVSEQIATLEACADCGDAFGFETASALLLDAIGDMKRLEDFSIGNLF